MFSSLTSHAERLVPVILAGGVSRRLWPLGVHTAPKPFLPLLGGEASLLQHSLARAMRGMQALSAAIPAAQPVVVTHLSTAQQAAEQAHTHQHKVHILVEPCPRNTAAAALLAALSVLAEAGDAILWFLPADHLLEQEDALHAALQRAVSLARAGYIVTFGITPSRVEPAYGHMLYHGEQVERFCEKPAAAEAAALLATGRCAWNSGMCVVRASVLREAMQRHAPDIASGVGAAWSGLQQHGHIAEAHYAAIPSLPLDVAVLERSENLRVVPLTCRWEDLGTWPRLYAAHAKDAQGNVWLGHPVQARAGDVRNALILNFSGPEWVCPPAEGEALVATPAECFRVPLASAVVEFH